jgi:hypothetical protein
MKADELWACAVKGAGWLAAQQAPDGRWRPLKQPCADAYYKGTWSLSLLGYATQAQRCLSYSVERLLQPDGDVLPRKHLWHREIHYLYANAYFVIGAARLGRYEVLRPTLQFLLSLQQPTSGGFASQPSVENGAVCCDSMSTAAAGLAALAAGRIDAACCAARWLRDLVKAQPQPQTRFLCSTNAEGQPVATFPTQDASWREVRTDQPAQTWYAVGLPFAFLVKLHQATGQRAHLELARWFFDFQERCVDAWTGPSSGKAGWGCAELYRMTGETRYREVALQVGAYIANVQDACGAWNAEIGQPIGATHTWIPQDFDTTAEFVLWLGEIASNLMARDGDPAPA